MAREAGIIRHPDLDTSRVLTAVATRLKCTLKQLIVARVANSNQTRYHQENFCSPIDWQEIGRNRPPRFDDDCRIGVVSGRFCR